MKQNTNIMLEVIVPIMYWYLILIVDEHYILSILDKRVNILCFLSLYYIIFALLANVWICWKSSRFISLSNNDNI